jgi:hypothetical protein
MSENILAKDTLESLMEGLFRQSENSMKVMKNSAASSLEISNAIREIIIDLQFQDRNTQMMENSVDIIGQCLLMFDDIQRQAEILVDEGTYSQNQPEIKKAVESILSVIKLGDIQKRYTKMLQSTGVLSKSDYDSYSPKQESVYEDVELF